MGACDLLSPDAHSGRGRHKTKTGYFWALARDDRPWGGGDPPGVAFTYAPGRSGEYAEKILKGFSGILQVDGYAGYNRLLQRTDQNVQLTYCWAHARRKLREVARNATAPIAEEGLKQIAALYRIEKDIRGQSQTARLATRQRTKWAYIFGAICPAKGKGAGLVMPWCDTHAMEAHLHEISAAVDNGAHAVVMVDQAGWHMTPKLSAPKLASSLRTYCDAFGMMEMHRVKPQSMRTSQLPKIRMSTGLN